MKTYSILVPGALAGILVAAVVFAAPLDGGATGKPATAPDRSEIFANATCITGAATVSAQAQDWNSALGSKRIQDRALVLAAGTAAAACAGSDA